MRREGRVLRAGDALTQLCVSAPREERFAEFYAGEPINEPMDYQFKNGSGPKDESFCRRLFRQTHADRAVALTESLPVAQVTYSGQSDTLSFSGFMHRAYHVQRWLAFELYVDEPGEYVFSLGTCGGARIWCNSTLCSTFTPFTRNTLQLCNITLPLKSGQNLIQIHVEELFERDTLFLLRLIYEDQRPARITLPGINSEALSELTQFTHDLRPELAVQNHILRIHVPSMLPALHLYGEIRGMGNDNFSPRRVDFNDAVIVNGELHLPLPHDLGAAHYQLLLSIKHQGIVLDFPIAINVLPDDVTLENSSSLSERKNRALEHIAREGMDRTCRLLAMMHLHDYGPQTEALLASTLRRINDREDCSDFSLVPLLWIALRYHGEHFSSEQWQGVRASILGYRYWIDEPGNDVMWFWSENHALCFHTAQYLAGQLYPDELFIASGRSGAQQQALAAQRLNQWFDAIDQHGFVEWNSAPYYPVDYIGLFAIYHLADAPWLRARAKVVIDRLMLLSSLHYQGGMASGTMGRVYEKELLAGRLTELSAYGCVAWGGGEYNRKCASLPLFCASDYQPPFETERYVLLKEGALSACYRCGGGNIIVWKQPGVALSSCVDHHTGKPGHQQHLMDVQFSSHPDTKIWINHPGDSEPGSEKRPSFWAGNGIMPRLMQVKNSAMLYWRIPADHSLRWTHAYLPQQRFDEVILLPRACIVRAGNAFAALICSSPVTAVQEGMTAGMEIRAEQGEVAWYVEVGEGDFSAFYQSMSVLSVHIDDDCARVREAGSTSERMALSWQGECRVLGVSHCFPTQVSVEPRIIYPDDSIAH